MILGEHFRISENEMERIEKFLKWYWTLNLGRSLKWMFSRKSFKWFFSWGSSILVWGLSKKKCISNLYCTLNWWNHFAEYFLTLIIFPQQREHARGLFVVYNIICLILGVRTMHRRVIIIMLYLTHRNMPTQCL